MEQGNWWKLVKMQDLSSQVGLQASRLILETSIKIHFNFEVKFLKNPSFLREMLESEKTTVSIKSRNTFIKMYLERKIGH